MALLCIGSARADRIWWEGTRDAENGPPGKLLSDNEGYWGECVLTGVEYTYEVEPDNPRDIWCNDASRFGRRLLDGRPAGDWWVPVGVSNPPLVVVMDFHRACRFAEIDLCTRSRQVAVTIQARDAESDAWTTLLERSRADCADAVFHRLVVPPGLPPCRHLRLSIEAEGITWLDEVLVWGDVETDQPEAEHIAPVTPSPVLTGVAFQSLPGAERTAFADSAFWEWRRSLGAGATQAAVWSRVPKWGPIADRPLLPAADRVPSRIRLLAARNEVRNAALALTNTSWQQPLDAGVALSAFRDARGLLAPAVRGELRAAGTIGSRTFGVGVGPLFAEGDSLGASLMGRYLTNGGDIARFPALHLPPAGSAVLWLSVATESAAPGHYEAELRCEGCPPLAIGLNVLDVTLPDPLVWLNTWSGVTSMFPFEYGDRADREVMYKQGIGVTVWHGFPEPNSAQAMARRRGRVISSVMALPDSYIHRGYNNQIRSEDLTAEDEAAIAAHVRDLVARAEALGLSYDDWFGELWDEPGPANAELFGALAAMVRRADPRVRIYCNPCFWTGAGVASDDEVHAALHRWYRDFVDVSVPLYLLVQDRPRCFRLFDAPRFVRASYTVSTQSAKSEAADQVQLYCRQAWDAFERGWNGWGFYSYFAPRGNPWDDFDASPTEDLPDYQMVYPGPRGPVPTRQSEAVRQGYQDYCLLSLLRARGQYADLERIVGAYHAGADMEALHDRALRAAAR